MDNILNKIKNVIADFRARQLININLTRGGIREKSRNLNIKIPQTWEFSGFSQNGEDGIIDILINNLKEQNNYIIEIGSSDGLQNNSTWLMLTRNYQGLLIEGNSELSRVAKRNLANFSIGSIFKQMFVDLDNLSFLKELATNFTPDIFSLDIDGIDYYVADKILENGFRPKIFVTEYNSAFGPKESITVKYSKNFICENMHPSHLYFGVSLNGWKNFFKKHGYTFITNDSNGVNCFFVDPKYFKKSFLQNIKSTDYIENKYFLKKFNGNYKKQFQNIKKFPFVKI